MVKNDLVLNVKNVKVEKFCVVDELLKDFFIFRYFEMFFRFGIFCNFKVGICFSGCVNCFIYVCFIIL